MCSALSVCVRLFIFFFYGYGDHRDLHVLTHSFPTRRSSDLGDRMAMLQLMGLAGVGLVAVSRVLRANGVIADLPIVDLGFYIAVLIEAFTTSVVVALRALALRQQRDRIAQERDQVMELAQTDELTGIPNRRAFISRSEEHTSE